jgi:hypothetical protein
MRGVSTLRWHRCAALMVALFLAASCGGSDGAGLGADAGSGGAGPGRGATKPGEPGAGGAGGSATAGTGGAGPTTGGSGGSGGGGATGGSGGAAGTAGGGGSGGGSGGASAGSGGGGGPGTGGSGMDASVDRAPDLAVDRPPDATADMPANPCTTGGVCEQINREYSMALARARACTPNVTGQCAEPAAQGLLCPGCQVWVNTRKELDPLIKRYADERCPELCRPPCPLPPCRAMLKGACVAASSQAAAEPDRIIAPPQGGYVCTESSLTTTP